MPVDYTRTASNGIKITNVIEVLEGKTIEETIDGFDVSTYGDLFKGKYTWKNEWYFNLDGSGEAVTNESLNNKLIGVDFTIYGKWVSIVIFNLASSSMTHNNTGWRPQAPVEIIKGQRCNGRDPYPESGDDWNTWWDSYTRYVFVGFIGSGNRIMSWNGSFIPTGNINLYPGQ